jgi:hypothetical protein
MVRWSTGVWPGVCLAGVLGMRVMATAEPLSVKAVMRPKGQIRYDFPTAQKHFLLFVHREGVFAGNGILTFLKGPFERERE